MLLRKVCPATGGSGKVTVLEKYCEASMMQQTVVVAVGLTAL